ncbi:ABC transporter substrate-binding protein [Rhizobium rhizogenes]|uniref:ABC transporter substrate-binding protein n=1 Tax=Rhizobium rhizogenes TaxID=359 RepID=UPI001572700F|nr:ABC transporter substrate-binding protein [Rhizobium rhizogenes]NTI78705.1 ABC transporter substrate-binding protein [Rhizobium rhizogenes]
MQTKRRTFLGLAAAAVLPTTFSIARAQSKPKVIRLAGPGNAAGRPYGSGSIGILRGLELLEKEFEPDGIRVEWQFPRGTGPAINEAFANGQLEFASYGGLPNIVGRGAGVRTTVLAASGISPTYVGVRPAAGIKTLVDLKGKKVAFQRGTIFELSLSLILASVGLKNGDVQIFDLQGADQTAALQSGDVDTLLGQGNQVLALVKSGLIEVLYNTKGPAPGSTFGSFTVIDSFAKDNPEIVARVLRRYVEASHFASQDENRNKIYDIWALTGSPRESYVTDYADDDLRDRNSPLLDAFYRANIKAGLDFTLEQKLARKPFNVDEWVQDGLLTKTLADLGYQNVWTPRSADGKTRA